MRQSVTAASIIGGGFVPASSGARHPSVPFIPPPVRQTRPPVQSLSTRHTGAAPPAQPPVVLGVAHRALPPPKPAGQHIDPLAQGMALVALAAVHVGAWQVLGPAAASMPPKPPVVVGWHVFGAVQSESVAQTALPFGHAPAVVGAAHVAPPPKPAQHRSGDVQSVFAVQLLATQVFAPLPVAGALQVWSVAQSESAAQTLAPFGQAPVVLGMAQAGLPKPPAQQISGDVQLVLVHGGGWQAPFAHVPPFAHLPVPVPLQSCVAPVGQLVSQTAFVAGRPRPPPAASPIATGSLQQIFDPHCAALVHWVTVWPVPEHAAAVATHA